MVKHGLLKTKGATRGRKSKKRRANSKTVATQPSTPQEADADNDRSTRARKSKKRRANSKTVATQPSTPQEADADSDQSL